MGYPIKAYGLSAADSWSVFKARGFGTFTICFNNEFFVSHVPFIVANEFDGDKATIELHLVSDNPMLKILNKEQDGVSALLTCHGGDQYIRPVWYGVDAQVPTWNFLVAEARGTMKLITTTHPKDDVSQQELIREHWRALSARFEEEHEQPWWEMSKMNEKKIQMMMRAVRVVRMEISTLSGHFKCAQHKTIQIQRAMFEQMKTHEPSMSLMNKLFEKYLEKHEKNEDEICS